MANTYLTRTMGSATSRYTFTLSMWVKRSKSGEEVFWNSYVSNDYRFQLFFNPSDNLVVYNVDNDVEIVKVETNRKFRDFNGWYHIYVAVKSSETTASDRIKIYVNGVQETSFSSATYQSTSNDMAIGTSSYALNIGRYGGNTAFFGGLMSHSYYVDGSIIDVTQFGSTDATTGEWKINTSPTIASYGNQGHLILKDGNTITDSSPNSNNFSLGGGTLTKTEDNPSNVFATMNPLTSYYAGAWTFSNGNNTVNMGTTSEKYVVATMGFSSGKWYWEQKYISESGETATRVGIESNINNTAPDQSTSGYGYRGQPAQKVNNGTYTSWGNTYTAGDIIGVAVDMDNNKIYFSINGVWQESGDPTSGATGTGSAFTIIDPPSGFYFPKIGKEAADTGVWSFNFGEGFFGTTAAGTQADDNGQGLFAYDVPAGYYALNTKNLEAYG
jgi:hypothetical protein